MDFEVCKNGTITIGKTLDKLSGEFVTIEIVQGLCISRDNISEVRIDFCTFSDYQHCTLIQGINGTVEFKSKNYTPSPYPEEDIPLLNMHYHSDGKVWAITTFNGNQLCFYSNDQTEHRLVHQVLNNSQLVSDRIREKELKGYVSVGIIGYDFLKRKLL